MNTKLHAVADANGRPLRFFMTTGQVSDYTGATALLDDLPKAQWLLGDRGYDADWFRDALQAKGIQPCIPGRRSRNEPVRYDKRRYRRRSRIEIMFGRLNDWRRVATRYDRCPTAFFSAMRVLAHARDQASGIYSLAASASPTQIRLSGTDRTTCSSSCLEIGQYRMRQPGTARHPPPIANLRHSRPVGNPWPLPLWMDPGRWCTCLHLRGSDDGGCSIHRMH